MAAFDHPAFDHHETVLFADDPASGLKAIIAVHSTRRGPACGGCRLWTYPDSDAALKDVLRLSRGMSYKNAVANLGLGGGKAVIMKPDGPFDKRAVFEAFGRAIERLNGSYITAEDVGVTPEDMAVVRSQTPYAVGLDTGSAASGDPSPVTARGVFLGIGASVEARLGKADYADLTVAVQGAGHVGLRLVHHLIEAGAKVFVTDVNADNLQAAVSLGATAVKPNDIYDLDVDVFAPCALGGVINAQTLDRLKAPVIAGAANNQLDNNAMGLALRRRGILYAPDYVINAGGIINVEGEVKGHYDPVWVEGKLQELRATLVHIFDRAKDENRPTADIAHELARERLGLTPEPTPIAA